MKKGRYAIILALISLMMYPINDIVCIGLIVVAMTYAILAVKDREVIVKVAQPALMLTFLYLIRALLVVIVGIINNIAMLGDNYYSSKLYENIVVYNRINSIVFMFLILVFAVLTVIFFMLNKDVPVVGKLARKIIGEKKEEQNQNNTNV